MPLTVTVKIAAAEPGRQRRFYVVTRRFENRAGMVITDGDVAAGWSRRSLRLKSWTPASASQSMTTHRITLTGNLSPAEATVRQRLRLIRIKAH